MSYFVKEAEIEEKQKDINSAVALALFLGAFGAHRFYLGRKLSGIIILTSVVLSLGQALWIVIPLIVIEFFQLAVTADRMKKMNTPEAVQAIPIPTKQAYVNRPERVQDDVRGVTIHDVSDIKTTKITGLEKASNISNPPSSGEWTRRLEVPYERRDLQVPQLRKSIYAMYENLAEYIDRQLRERGSSLHQLMRQKPRGQYAYYSNILYTIFCIAEGHVTDYYTGGIYRGYNNTFSYDLLRGRIDEQFRENVEEYAKKLASKLPPADDEIKKHFGLTANGLPTTWWDQDGLLREKYPLTEKHMRILNVTPQRNTKLFETAEIRVEIFRHYFKVLSLLHKQLTQSSNWPKRMEKYLKAVFEGETSYVDNHYRIMILNYILKLCEQAVREKIPYTRPLDITKERTTLKKTIPSEAAQAVFLAINDPGEIHLSDATLEILRKQNPTSWKEDVADIASKNVSEVIMLLNSYQSDAITKVAKEIVKKSPDKDSRLLALYAASISGRRDDWIEKKILLLIHPDQQRSFEQLVAKAKPLSTSLSDELAELQVAPRKRVVLDKSRLAMAKNDHIHAVNSVNSYLGDDLESSESQEVTKPEQPTISKDSLFDTTIRNDVSLTDDQIEFLDKILKSENSLDGKDATEFAKQHNKMLNGYIQSVNKALYEKFQDQVILQQNGRIMIEEEYRVAVEELI